MDVLLLGYRGWDALIEVVLCNVVLIVILVRIHVRTVRSG